MSAALSARQGQIPTPFAGPGPAPATAVIILAEDVSSYGYFGFGYSCSSSAQTKFPVTTAGYPGGEQLLRACVQCDQCWQPDDLAALTSS